MPRCYHDSLTDLFITDDRFVDDSGKLVAAPVID